MLGRHFRPAGPVHELKPEIREMVTFAYLNLVEDAYPALLNGTNGLDLILCRNVTIYFESRITQQILERLGRCLVPGGWLLVGPSEPNLQFYRAFEAHNFPGAVCYRKPADGAAPARLPRATQEPLLRPRAPARRPPAAPLPPPPLRPTPAPRAREPVQPDRAPARADLEAVVTKAEEALQRGDTEAAVRMVEAALEAVRRALYLDPGLVPAHFTAAVPHAAGGRRRAAEKAVDNVLSLLQGRPPEEAVEHGEGMTVGRLRQLALQLREAWEAGPPEGHGMAAAGLPSRQGSPA